MQSGISASRERLKDQWQQAYLTAPIWRFWLGADICGVTVVGALMSSLDGIGRYYPLTVFAVADAGGADPATRNRLTGRMVYRDRRVPSFHARSGCFLRIDYGGA